jgi:flagellum-specific ATP synthase
MTWLNYVEEIQNKNFHKLYGRVTKVSNLSVHAEGLNGNVGDICSIKLSTIKSNEIFAQIISQSSLTTILMPLGEIDGISIGAEISCLNESLKVPISEVLLGQVIDPLGNSLSNHNYAKSSDKVSIRGVKNNPLNRKKISNYLTTGVRAIDAFLSIGQGQRIGIFSGSGVGKSTLLGMIAKNSYADVNVIALIGERGREVNDFIYNTLNQESMAKSVIVVATADQPTLIRELAAHTATAIAEYFCNKNKNVLLIMDSVTRFAMARREIGLSIGEPATARGYTPSTFTELPKLIERAGNFSGKGSITGIYTVLVEGDDLNEPISDHMRAILDGHIVLSRDLADHNHYPAIDVLKSISRLANDIWNTKERSIVKDILKLLSVREKHKDIVEIGAYKAGSNQELDKALALYPRIQDFLIQDVESAIQRDELFDKLSVILNS